MGTHTSKKKSSPNILVKVVELKRDQDLDANKEALQPTFELGVAPYISTSIDFVNVTDSVDPSQG